MTRAVRDMTPFTGAVYASLAIGYAAVLLLTGRCEKHYQENPNRYIPGSGRVYVLVDCGGPPPRPRGPQLIDARERFEERRREHGGPPRKPARRRAA
jgi:hypothetical protein